jgi:phosphate transport system substrate-binding protein
MKEAVQAAQKRPGMLVASTDHDAADSLEKLAGALGSSTLAIIVSEKRPLKALKVNGVEPTVETIADRSYPYWKAMLFVTGPRTGAAAHEFIAFVRSPAGREMLGRTGHWVK